MLQESMQYPPHVTQLLKDLLSYSEASDVLLRHADYVSQDTSLYHVYVTLGYSPEAGNFITSPSNQDAIRLLKNEYKDLLVNELTELKVFHADSMQDWEFSKGMKEEFLRTYLDNRLQEYADPSEIGLEESTIDYEDSSSEHRVSTPVWLDSSPVKTTLQVKTITPSPSFKPSNNHTSRSDKGLKNLSVRVQHIVCQRQHTSYKQVADDLIKELEVNHDYDNEKEEKNIRRRVYDALNVLVAADVVKKSGKTISWNHVSPDRSSVDETNSILKSEHKHRIFNKRQTLKDLHSKSLALQALIHRNKCNSKNSEAIPFPFIIAGTCDSPSNSVIVDINPTNTEVCIKFVHEITLFGDLDILLKLDLHRRDVSFIPEELKELIYQLDEPPKIMKLLDDSF